MTLILEAEVVPLMTDSDGVARVAGTRVTLDTVVNAFHDGLTAEEVVEQYPSLELGAVYAVIGYYLRHQAEVDAYLASRAEQRDEVRRENERRWPSAGIRTRLVGRRA